MAPSEGSRKGRQAGMATDDAAKLAKWPSFAVTTRADDEFQQYSGLVSQIVRTLALTAIAIVWLFSGGGSQTLEPGDIVARMQDDWRLNGTFGLAIACLVADLLQYVWAASAWGIYRWIWDQLLLNDPRVNGASVSLRFAWRVSRLYGIPRYLESAVDGPDRDEVDRGSWIKRRDSLRAQLRSLRTGTGQSRIHDALDVPIAPIGINRPTIVFFTVKVIAILFAFILLGTFILH